MAEHERPDDNEFRRRFVTQLQAVVVVDMQRDFLLSGAPLMAHGGEAILRSVNQLTAAARAGGVPVVFTHEVHRADTSDYGIEVEYDPRHCEEGTVGAELHPALSVAPADYHVYKRRYDAFEATDLDLLLRGLGVRNVLVCGVDTDICVLGTVVSARNHDYRVAVVADCCAGTSPAHHDAALLCMGTVFARVVDCAWGQEVVAAAKASLRSITAR